MSRKSRRNRHFSGQQPNPGKDANTGTDQKENGTAGPDRQTPTPRGEVHQPEPGEKLTEAKPQEKHWLDFATGLFAFIAAVGGLFAAVFAGSQALIAREAEIRQLRAYVGVSPGDIENLGDLKTQAFTFKKKNYGLTPAYDADLTFASEGVIELGKPTTNLNPMPELERRQTAKGNPSLFPSAEVEMRLVGGASKEDMQRLANEDNLRFEYSGTIRYHDAFGHPRFTNFCWLFRANQFKGKDAGWCQGHNDSD